MRASMPPYEAATNDGAYDVVVVGASAGGLPALRELVRGLGQDFALPLVAMLHLPPGAEPESVLQRLDLRVERLQGRQQIASGTLWMCPPRAFVELLPDGTAVVIDNPQGAMGKPIDRLLGSTARSFGPRAIGVVLSGMGNDGATGAGALRAAGGRVLAQSPESCEYADMPTAAIQAGATDLVVPLAELGDVLAELAQGAPSARTRAELRAVGAAFSEQGDVALAARERDWQATSLGPVLAWPEPLRALVREGVDSPHAVALWWGRDQTEVYNEAWNVFLGARHPGALGRPARLNWGSDWERIDPLVEQVLNQGRPAGQLDLAMPVRRGGATEEVFAKLSLAPLRDASGRIAGIRAMLWETTFDVLAQRRMRLLHALATRLTGAATRHEACQATAAAFETDGATVPFGLVYLVEPRGLQATLASAAGLQPGSPAAPHLLHLAATGTGAWPLARVVGEPGSPLAEPAMLDLADGRLPELASLLTDAAGGLRASQVLLAPLRAKPSDASLGVLVLGLAPHRPYDGAHARFVETVVQQVAAGLGYARAKELERERSDRLATLDRAKTEFFANVSHEFRTPLTLLLAPLDALTRARDTLPAPVGAELDVAVRSARRLLRMVNSLLDFSQIDVRGRKAPVAQTDLGLLTMDIASAFRSAIEAAGLALQVDIAPGLPTVPVNSSMWEQIVSNLLANAFKFTFEGTITVRVKALRLHAELEVSDTGIGIPTSEQQNIFKRFHRVRGARARTAEGAGIGLALVQDLTHRMGGQLTLRSVEGHGSTFTVWLPLRAQPLRTEMIEDDGPPAQPLLASDLAFEAARWLAGPDTELSDVTDDLLEPPAAGVLPGARGRILVVDDNADMREYLQRLLAGRWSVQLAPDGAQALAMARAHPPDLVLTDVMMPALDGFQLLQQLRAEPPLARIPVLLLTARASEEAAIEGLRAGADDYIAKPFSPRELLARLQAALDRARADAALRESEAKYRLLIESMDEACAVVEVMRDAQGQWADFLFIQVNPAFIRQTSMPFPVGKTATQLLGTPNPRWAQLYGQAIDSAQPLRVEESEGTLGRTFDLNIFSVDAARSRVAVIFADITERKRAEASLRHREERQSFLLRLGDATWQVSDPAAVQDAAARLLREHLHADQVGYGEVVDDDNVIAPHGWRRGQPVAAGTLRYGAEGREPRLVERQRAGRTVVSCNVEADTTLGAEEAAAFLGGGTRAHIAAPCIKNGRRVAVLTVHSAEPREWQSHEIELVEEAVARTWSSVERARAEAALHESEQRFRQLFDSIDEGFCIIEMLFEGEMPVDYRFIEVNPTFERHTGIVNAKGRRMRDIAPDHEQHWFDRYGEVALTGQAVNFEAPAKALGDRWYDVKAFRLGAPELRHVAIVFTDLRQLRSRPK